MKANIIGWAVFVLVILLLTAAEHFVPQKVVHEWKSTQVQCPPCACPECLPPVPAPKEEP
jgi:hypothetical protein